MKRPSGPDTAAILRVHPSNYKICGFTAEVPLADLVEIGHAARILVIDDVGAGPLVDFSRFGFDKEPTLQESVQAGADLTTASADKLIGASQGGIILGRADLIQAVRKNPLARIVRVGKLTLAALEATLSLFLDEPTALREVPTLRMLCRGLAEISAQAERIALAIGQRTSAAVVTTAEGFSQMGSGSLPTQNCLPDWSWSSRNPSSRASLPPDSAAIGRRSLPAYTTARCWSIRARFLDGEEQVLVEAFVQALRQGSDGFPNPSYTIR